MNENNFQSGSWVQKNFLSVSILIAAVLIAGSIFYAFGRGGGTGAKQYPNNAFTKCLDTHKYASKISDDYNAANQAGVHGTPTVFVNGKPLGNWIPINAANPFTTPSDLQAVRKVLDAALTSKVDNSPAALKITSADSVLGNSNAPVTIIEYGDYQCPWCGKFFTEVEPMIRQEYIQTGKARFVFRNFQFLGSESAAAAEAVACAGDQGQYWAYHDAIYTAEHQDGHENNGNLNKDLFEAIAQNLKLNAP